LPTLTAEIAIEKNGYVVDTDFSEINVEYQIDDLLDYINLLAETSIASMSGTAGSKSVTLSRDENAAVSIGIACMLREAKKTTLSNSSSTSNSTGASSSIGVGNISASESSSVSASISAASSLNSADDLTRQLFEKAIARLKQVVNEIQVSYG
jgi:hypothetical protein